MTYKAHYLVPVTYTFEAANDKEAECEADRIADHPRELTRKGDPGCPDLGCDALITENERTVFEV